MNEHRIRGFFILIGFSIIFILYLGRLYYLQAVSNEYALASEAKDLDVVTLIPSRGMIYDRTQKIYVKNSPVYDVQFIPKDIKIQPSDTAMLEELLGIDRKEIVSKIKEARGNERYRWADMVTRLDHSRFAAFSEKSWRFEGMKVVPRMTREYVYPCGAHFLGYINEVTKEFLADKKDSGDTLDYHYKRGDLTGIVGIEKEYERLLRGKKGQKMIIRDVFNREIGPYAEGKYDVMPESGLDIQLGVDVDLQMLGERLMQNKRGSVVAIEPSTGEILAYVSAPSYDPSLLTGSDLGKNYFALLGDKELPLINRPIQAEYSPGSIFKILQALVALGDNVITEDSHFGCGGRWFRNRGKPACHGAHGSCGLPLGIKQSCNSFFAEVYYQFLNSRNFEDVGAAYERWREVMTQYGVGVQLGVDIPNEKDGNLPTRAYYDRLYKKSWGALTIYSNSIGQGEVLMTPLQMANSAAIIANRGWYYPPHFLKSVRKGNQWLPDPYERQRVPGTARQFDVVVDAMQTVVESGTARRARIDSVAVCGKTGTVENPHGEDHSVFMAFAPKENPKIAIACIVENAGFGGTWSAPICSLMMEYYLTGEIKNEFKLNRILEADFLEEEAEAEEQDVAQN